jgi:hypothetical protein
MKRRRFLAVAGFMFLAALILLVVFDLDAIAAPAPSSTTVNNTAANPVPTVDVENPAKQPFQASGFASHTTGNVFITTVPAGTRLVIETVTFQGSIISSGIGLVPTLSVFADGNPATHVIGVNLIGQDATRSVWSATHAVRLYADPSTNVILGCSTFSSVTTERQCIVSISGHLVNVP